MRFRLITALFSSLALLVCATHYDGKANLEGDTYIVSVQIDVDDESGRTTLGLQGPESVWFGVGFGNGTMEGSWAIIIDDEGEYETRVLGDHNSGNIASDDISVDRELVKSSVRQLTVYRSNTGDDYTFPASAGAEISVILAIGNDSSYEEGNHIHKQSVSVVLEGSDIQSTFIPGEDCSAVSAYVSVKQPSLLYQTLVSAEVLWEPYSYYLGRTETVHVECSVLCNETIVDWNVDNNDTYLSMLVEDKMVLVERGECIDRCREHEKVYNAQRLGAVAVLIYNDRGYDTVEELEEDSRRNNRIRTRIPARMISQTDGLTLASYAEQAAVNDSKLPLEMAIGCFDNGYPADLCVLEYGTEADSWKLDGTYQQLSEEEDGEDALYNDHPVWRKEGYKNFLRDRYIWMNDDLTWVISGVDVGRMDRAQAICADDGYDRRVTDPSLCRHWIEKGDSNEEPLTLNVSSRVCDGSDSKYCLKSDNSHVSGLKGTYEQIANYAAYWTRDVDDLDMAPGVLYWYERRGDRYRFELEDTIDEQIIAYCETDDESIRLNPNECPVWYVITDSTTENDAYKRDDSLEWEEGYCEGETIIPGPSPPSEQIPEFLCLTDHSLNHVFLEGEYALMDDVVTSGNNRSVWINERLEDSSLPAYMYYAGGYSTTNYPYWIIANRLPNENNRGNEMNRVRIYGYCPSNTELPTQCESCWYFYYNDAFDADCEAELTPNMCATTTAPNSEDYSQEMCLSFDQTSNHNNGDNDNDDDRRDSSDNDGSRDDSSSDNDSNDRDSGDRDSEDEDRNDDDSSDDNSDDSDDDDDSGQEHGLSEDMKRLTGTWILNDVSDTHDGRAYWTHTELDRSDKDVTYDRYMYYEKVWRYWMIGANFSQSYFYCIEYEKFDPSECSEWKYWNGSVVEGLRID